MPRFTVEVTIPENLKDRFDVEVARHGGDPAHFVNELVMQQLQTEGEITSLSDSERETWIDQTFAAIDRKYGEALRNLAN